MDESEYDKDQGRLIRIDLSPENNQVHVGRDMC